MSVVVIGLNPSTNNIQCGCHYLKVEFLLNINFMKELEDINVEVIP